MRAAPTDLESLSAQEVLAHVVGEFHPRLYVACSFQKEASVILDMLLAIEPEARVFTLDTGVLFPETYALRDQLAERLGLRFTRVATRLTLEEQAKQFGDQLWARDPNQCCQLRKVQPLREYLVFKDAWITAIRRDQTANRANAGLVEWDSANGLVKLNPLAAWTKADVWAYLHIHELPYNKLHDVGFRSIGCEPCTRATNPGGHEREGRWWWEEATKRECGLHIMNLGNG